MNPSKRRSAARFVLGCVLSLTVAACGTQVSEQRLAAGAGSLGAQSATDPQTAAAAGQGPVTGTTGTGAVPGAGAAAGIGTGLATAAGSATGTGTGTAPGAGTANGSGVAGTANKPGAAGTGVSATGPASPCSTTLAPIRLGQTLVSSGLVGAVLGNLRAGLALWVADVNARGGVQCHPIELYAMDDGSDPARVQQNYNTLVNDKKVIAMVGVGTPVADTASQSSAERLKVPVVGGDLTSTMWTNSPYIFPQGSAIIPAFAGGVREAALSKGGKRGGLMYCVEATICSSQNAAWEYITKNAGVAKGLSKAVSITQSDYTADCQAMKDDGVDVLFTSVDGSATSRIARSCNALNYFPVLAAPGVAVNPAAAADPLIQKFTLFQGVANAPFPTTDTKALKEFHAGVDRFAPGAALDQPYLQGWLAGKLFEAAMAKVSTEARQGAVTTAMVLKGLGQIKNETLDGAAAPLTFTPGKPAPLVECYFTLKIDTKGTTAPNGSAKHCF